MLNVKNSQIGSSSCRCSTTSIGQEMETMDIVFRIQKESRHTRRDSRRDTGSSSVLEVKRNCTELSVVHLNENETLQPLRWWNDSKKPVFQYSRVSVLLSRVILKKRGTETPYTSMRMHQTQSLLFRIVHSVNQLKYLREQFGSTENAHGQEKPLGKGESEIAGVIWKGHIPIADLEELEKLDASEIYPRRINAKEVPISQKGDEFKIPVADGAANLSGRDYKFGEPTL